jgi:hypothetical protein
LRTMTSGRTALRSMRDQRRSACSHLSSGIPCRTPFKTLALHKNTARYKERTHKSITRYKIAPVVATTPVVRNRRLTGYFGMPGSPGSRMHSEPLWRGSRRGIS